jgi:Fe-S-cluster-containing dehydrogenase component/anaerobic selenocysteine-containing dehydrogenase
MSLLKANGNSMPGKKKYWKSIEEFRALDSPSNAGEGESGQENVAIEEIANDIPLDRRDFLKVSGFGLTAATLAMGCEAPIQKAIPFVIKPEEIFSGVANYYASSFMDGADYCGIVVKTREGRPIKIEGNELSGVTKGGTNARAQASVLSLYDEDKRLRGPLLRKNPIAWDRIDENIAPLLKSINAQGGKIIILSQSIFSPSTKAVFEEFVNAYPVTKIVYYDTMSASGMLMANKHSFGKQIIPHYRFDKADIIVSFGADFLGTWLSPVEFSKQWVQNRKLGEKHSMSRHYQFESGMSLTGSNADYRFPIKPSEEGPILANLYNELAKIANAPVYEIDIPDFDLKPIATELWQNKAKSIVLSGSNDVNLQILVNAINVLLSSYGKTIDLNRSCHLKQGIDEEMINLVDEMNNGQIDALIINSVNPVYNYPEPNNFINGLKKIKLTVSFSSTMDETASLVNYVCPDNHYLESWNDAEPLSGFFSLCQPTINRLFDTRSAQDSLLKWMGNELGFYNYILQYWESEIYPLKKDDSSDSGFKKFWIKSLQDGVFEVDLSTPAKSYKFDHSIIGTAIDHIDNLVVPDGVLELQLYESIALGNGSQANNPWLQELPDPITKACWDNYASISPRHASEMKLKNGDIVTIHSNTTTINLPVIVQPGQAYQTISVAVGYGRENAGKVGDHVGKNIFPFAIIQNGTIQYSNRDIEVTDTNKKHKLALTQTHHSMEGRAIVRETTLEEYTKNHSAGNEVHVKVQEQMVSLYADLVHDGYHWSLAIDLNACTGCGACIIACQAENNIPVIGKVEMQKRRDMHWMRIDRYYSDAIDDPLVYHQPIMCQHCDNAPCENVCPVAATMHSDDGLNHMTYNRCIGTRYCMNNCPYKVRRFNWFNYFQNVEFDYNMNSDYGRMVLNPDVVVRSRGVVEKCTMCVQRIQEKKGIAKLENRLLEENEIKPACLQACPSEAIVFGNKNDMTSKISELIRDERNYYLLEEIHALPSIGYLVKVRNNDPKITIRNV